jgi:hypothetical protein
MKEASHLEANALFTDVALLSLVKLLRAVGDAANGLDIVGREAKLVAPYPEVAV